MACSFNALQSTTQWYLITLFGWIRTIRIGKMDMRCCVLHDFLDVVATTTNDKWMIRIGNVHFHDNTASLRLWNGRKMCFLVMRRRNKRFCGRRRHLVTYAWIQNGQNSFFGFFYIIGLANDTDMGVWMEPENEKDEYSRKRNGQIFVCMVNSQ